MAGPPFVVIEAGPPGALAAAGGEVEAQGWRVVDGWAAAGQGVVCAGVVSDDGDLRRAVLAAVAGAGLIVDATAPRELVDRLCDDLRRLGPVDHRIGDPGDGACLTDEDRALLGLLMAGMSLGDAARALHLSRRTADRRLARARQRLGASSTTEAVALAHRLGVRPAP